MSFSVTSLRFGLILIPGILGLYAGTINDYGRYTLFILLFLALAVLGSRFFRPEPITIMFSLVEIAISGWLCQHYGVLMIFVSLSSVFTYLFLSRFVLRYAMLGIHLLVLNVSLQGHENLWMFTANILFVIVAILSRILNNTAGSNKDTLRLYDELRRKHFELEEARSEMQQLAYQIEGAAQAEERSRISRQLHDDIGHRLIRVKMMMEAAIYTVPQDADRGMQLLHQIRDQIGASMDEMRTAVKQIHPGRQMTDAYALDRLLEEVGRETGILTRFQIKGLPYPLYPSQQVVLYKNAREAITNAIRHGRANEVAILIVYGDSEVCMEVSNNGGVTAEDSLDRSRNGSEIGRKGIGLSGMMERTSVVGGKLEVIRQVPFTVITRLPVYRKSEIV